MPNFTVVTFKMWAPPKLRKMVIFGINLSLRKYSGGRQKMLNIGAQYKPSLCTDTVIVLKITLLHSVSVITNFVIPQRDKQKQELSYRQQIARQLRT